MTISTVRMMVILLAMILPAGMTHEARAQGLSAKGNAAAKQRGKPTNPLEVKRLDARLEEVRESFLRDTTNLIMSYENLGQFERAKTLLESLQKLDPRNEPIKAKLGELNAKILENNEFDVEIDPDASWQPIGTVTKDRPIRIRVTGDYKLAASLTVGPDGVPTADFAEDLVAHVPLGAVMGVIAPAGSLAQLGSGKQGDKPPRPFAIGSGFDKAAERDGVLYLKVNVPPETKCTGRLTAKVSGPDRPTP
jgi:hypothetical protein